MAPTFAIGQVLTHQRPAWTNGYHYDGINFWCWVDGERRGPPLTWNVVPTEGWRHRAHCTCPGCKERSPG